MLCVLLRSLLDGGLDASVEAFSVKIEPASGERRCHFCWRASHFPETPRVNVTPATIESTVALPCGPRPLLAAGAQRVSAPSRPDSDRAEADAAKTAFLQACERPRLP